MKRAVGILSTAAIAVFAGTLAFADSGVWSDPAAAGRETSGTGQHLDLHFPQTALQNLNTGDRVTVQLAIRKAGETGTSGGSGTSGARSGEGGMGAGTGGGMR